MKADTKVFSFPFLFPKSLLPEFAPKVWKMFDPLQVIFFWWQILHLKHQALLSQLPTAHNFAFETVAKSKTTNLIKVLFEWPHSGSSPKKILRGQTTTTMARVLPPFLFVLDGGSHSWNVVLSSYIFPLFVGDDKDVAI